MKSSHAQTLSRLSRDAISQASIPTLKVTPGHRAVCPVPITGHFSANDLNTYVHTSVPRFPSISSRSKGCLLSWFEDIGKERRKKVGPYNSGLVQIMERGQPWNNCEVRISIFSLFRCMFEI